MKTFDELALPMGLRASLARMGFSTPTPIQAQSIPHALEGRDILGTAQTGSGKTGAFGIPLIARLMTNSRGIALIMTPTRELAAQVIEVFNNLLGPTNPIKAVLLIGGEPMGAQTRALRTRPRIIIGTPGRINDHLEQGNLMLMETSVLVLDEMDRMLDMGFAAQIDRIVKFVPKTRQTMLFSATLPAEIKKAADKYLNDPIRVAVGAPNVAAKKIEQKVIRLQPDQKYKQLVKELDTRAGSIIVFVKTKHGAEKMADKLHKERFGVDTIHGDLEQRQRERVIAAYRERRFRILVATDIAARGLDIPHIEHVINYDLPHAPEDYIHRIGRTARAGADGAAISFVTPEDEKRWDAIERLLNPDAAKTAPAAKPALVSTQQAADTEGAPSKRRRRRSRGGRKSPQAPSAHMVA
jgi:superfamily II DNA/RNA helicase